MRKSLICCLKSFLTAYALSVPFYPPLQPAAYETSLDYVIASVYALVGFYDLKFILLFVLCFFFYRQFAKKLKSDTTFSGKGSALLSVFFSLCLLIGRSCNEKGSLTYCFGSSVNFIKFTLAMAGLSILFHEMILLLSIFLSSHQFTDQKKSFFTQHAFTKSFLIIMAVFMPFLILSFPGKLCWDAIGQIEQVIGSGSYSTHHPLFHTLLMGGLTKLGLILFHSYEAGLFVYILLQAAMLAAALSATIAILAKRSTKSSFLFALLLIYCVTPVYSNMASTALKDVPYSASVIGYVICLALLLETPEKIENSRFLLCFIPLQIFVLLFRNNGLYVVLLSGIGCFCFLCKQYDFRRKIRYLVCSFGVSIAVAELILVLLMQALGAAAGSKGEMLSIPFQQTARYLQLYREDLDQEEKDAIEAILGDVNTVAANYDPAISDPVKALFHKDASLSDMGTYLKAWFKGLCRHPAVYVEAFLIHTYGWFDPALNNSIRYESDYDVIRQGGLFPGAERLLIFYYRIAGRISLLAVFENVGAAVWALFFLTFYQKKTKQNAAALAGFPLWISLLICMASPGFFLHPRYAFPILFTIPFMYGFTLTSPSQKKSDVLESKLLLDQKG